MSEEKKEADVHDLKPSKDVKGGGRRGHHRSQGGGGHGGSVNGLNTAGRGKHYQQ
jgi:hypothetical protein